MKVLMVVRVPSFSLGLKDYSRGLSEQALTKAKEVVLRVKKRQIILTKQKFQILILQAL